VIVLLSGGQEVKRYEKEIAQAECHQDNPSNERQCVQRGSHAYACCHRMPYPNLSERFSSDRGESTPALASIVISLSLPVPDAAEHQQHEQDSQDDPGRSHG
jgi:hypothetical protein